MFTLMSHVVLCMADIHTANKQHVKFFQHCRALTVLPKYTREKRLCYQKYQLQNFMESFYIPGIQKIAFCFPHVCILGTHHFVKERRDEFKIWGNLHDVLCFRDYAEQVVASFSHQIQSEYYGGNRSVSNEGVYLVHFNASHHPIPLLAIDNMSQHAVFCYFFLMT